MDEIEARAVLGISATATLSDARKAQRDLAKVFHPDRHASGSPEDIARTTDAMARINQAYDTLERLENQGCLGTNDEPADRWASTGPRVEPRPAHVNECFMCGYGPAAPATFRAYAGFLLWFSSQHFGGSFCRSCGHMLFRETQAINLARGWWGLVIFPMVFSLVANIANWRQLRKLGTPATRDAAVVSPLPSPAPKVRPVIARPSVWIASGIAGFLLVSFIGAATYPSPSPVPAPATPSIDIPVPSIDSGDVIRRILEERRFEAGSCWSAPDASEMIEPVGCANPRAAFEVSSTVGSDRDCPTDSVGFLETDDGQVACLRERR